MNEPLKVVVTWDDACARHVDCAWDGTFETAAKIALEAPLYKGRQSIGWLVYVDAEALWLAHDYDELENGGEVGSLAVIPLGWVSQVKTLRGKMIYTRRQTPASSPPKKRKRAPKE